MSLRKSKPKPAPALTVIATAVATQAYHSKNPRELTFVAGDKFDVHRYLDNSWLRVTATTKGDPRPAGLVPASHVSVTPVQEPSAKPVPPSKPPKTEDTSKYVKAHAGPGLPRRSSGPVGSAPKPAGRLRLNRSQSSEKGTALKLERGLPPPAKRKAKARPVSTDSREKGNPPVPSRKRGPGRKPGGRAGNPLERPASFSSFKAGVVKPKPKANGKSFPPIFGLRMSRQMQEEATSCSSPDGNGKTAETIDLSTDAGLTRLFDQLVDLEWRMNEHSSARKNLESRMEKLEKSRAASTAS